MEKTKVKAFNSVEDFTKWESANCARCVRGININDGNTDFRCRTHESIYEQSVGITDEISTRAIVLTSRPVCSSLRLRNFVDIDHRRKENKV